jgi:cortical fragment-lytic enzyme
MGDDMAFNYTIRAGDTLAEIADRFGMPSWQSLYNDPANAAFKAHHPNPDLIEPGDVIVIPSSHRPFKYTVKPGDSLSSIAAKFGISSWQALYNDPLNAAFKAHHPNPDLIEPGDILVISGKPAPHKSLQTN